MRRKNYMCIFKFIDLRIVIFDYKKSILIFDTKRLRFDHKYVFRWTSNFVFFWNRCCVFWSNVVLRCFYECLTQFLLFCMQKIDIDMQFQRENKILKHCQLKIRSFWNFELVVKRLSRKLHAISSFCNRDWNFVENVFWNFEMQNNNHDLYKQRIVTTSHNENRRFSWLNILIIINILHAMMWILKFTKTIKCKFFCIRAIVETINQNKKSKNFKINIARLNFHVSIMINAYLRVCRTRCESKIANNIKHYN